jgi:hypothetical protein
MPGTMKMFFNNNNQKNFSYYQQNNANLATVTKKVTTINSPMIARIHNIKPGCGSCGR